MSGRDPTKLSDSELRRRIGSIAGGVKRTDFFTPFVCFASAALNFGVGNPNEFVLVPIFCGVFTSVHLYSEWYRATYLREFFKRNSVECPEREPMPALFTPLQSILIVLTLVIVPIGVALLFI